MKKAFALLVLSSLIFSACQTTVVEEAEDTVEPSDKIAEPTDMTETQTFQSEGGDFDYTLTWYTDVVTLADDSYEGATENAPSFDIVGGGHISLATGPIDAPGYKMYRFVNDMFYGGEMADWLNEEPSPLENGTAYPVYDFYLPVEYNEACIIKYGVVKGLNEALAVRLEDCDDNDMKSSQAFGSILSNLEITQN